MLGFEGDGLEENGFMIKEGYMIDMKTDVILFRFIDFYYYYYKF